MPGYHQNTFTLITERVAPVTDEPIRPMTSKQVKKAHKAANKAPKLSRAEQRKLELAEQERIRKELEKDRQANRARLAREKKKAKEDQEKQERRKKGRPLVDVRPSQDLIARFVRGNGWGKQKETAECETPALAPVVEEESDKVDEVDEGAGDLGGLHDSESDDHEARSAEVHETKPSADPDAVVLEKHPKAVGEPQQYDFDGDKQQNSQNETSNGAARVRSHTNTSPPGPSQSPRLSSSTKQEQRIEVDTSVNAKPSVASQASQAFWDDGLDDDLMQELGATQGTNAVRDDLRHGHSLPSQSRPSQGRPSQARPTQAAAMLPPPATQASKRTHGDGTDDDVLAGIGTQAVGQWEEEELEFMSSQHHLPSLRQPNHDALVPMADRISAKSTAEDDEEALQAIEAMFEHFSSKVPVLQPPLPTKNHSKADRLERQQSDAKLQASKPKLNQLSSFSEDDLDDELLQQLEIGVQPEKEPTTTTANSSQSRQRPRTVPKPPAAHRRPSPHQVDLGLNKPMAPPPIPQPPPMSTQAVLSNLDDYFPSPSQQERELDDDFGDLLKSQPTPCPPPKRPRSQQQRPPEPSPVEQPKSQKRFFSASGSNELLSLAIHRSKRDAAMQDLHRKEQQRLEAGRVQAQQARQQGRQFLAQPSNALRPVNNQTGRAPRPAGKPPTLVTNENIEPPPKRQKIARTKSQVRPPVFKQPSSSKPTSAHKPPVFKPPTKPTLQTADKENCRQSSAAAPAASQGSDYGGDWIDEMAMDMASAGRGCLSATQLVSDRGNGSWIR